MDTVKFDRKAVKLVAHRGLSGLETQNTVAAFVAAGNRDYVGIETDVHKTADGRYVVIHDSTTARVSWIEMTVEESTFEELRKLTLLDLNGNLRADLHIPSLEEYLDTCRRYGKLAVLELKGSFDKESVSEILALSTELLGLDRMIFISFDYQNLVYLRELSDTAKLQFLTSKPIDEALVARLLAYRMDLDAHYGVLTEELVTLLHENGIEINCWTVDDPEIGERLAAWGVDYITTNILQ